MGRKTQSTPSLREDPIVNSSNPSFDPDDADFILDEAFRRRRRQQLAERSEPTDPASGTSRVSARLATARADALARPRVTEAVIDLT